MHNLSEMNNLTKCLLCNFRGELHSFLIEHMMNDHQDPKEVKPIKCSLCDFKTKWSISFKQHMATHRRTIEIDTYKCEMCLFKSNVKEDIEKHALEHKKSQESEWYKCFRCSFETKYTYYLAKHICSDVNCNKHVKRRYEYLTDSPEEIVKPKHNYRPGKEDKVHICRICKFDTRDLNTLIEHKKQRHKAEYKCSQCDFQTHSRYSLDKHKESHRDSENGDSRKCSRCSYATDDEQDLTQHMLVHANPDEIRMLECHLCNVVIKGRKTLEHHYINQHTTLNAKKPIELYKCEKCLFKTKHKTWFLRHMTISHNITGLYMCRECPYSTQTEDELKNHLPTHVNPQLFKCGHCPLKTTSKREFKRHMIKHLQLTHTKK